MRTIKLITMAALAAAGTLGAAAPRISANDRPTPPPPLVKCAGGETDIGDGRGSYYCVPSDNIQCPGTWTDNGNGVLDYGECLVGGGSNPTNPPATQPPATQPPATQPPATNPPSGTNPSGGTNPPATSPSGSADLEVAAAAPTTVDPGPVGPPSLSITFAQVECNGMIHIEYNTAANPAPSTDVTHLIVFHAASAPEDYNVIELTGQTAFGAYSFEHLGSVDDTYRVWITVMFDTLNPDVPTLTDWADVVPPADC